MIKQSKTLIFLKDKFLFLAFFFFFIIIKDSRCFHSRKLIGLIGHTYINIYISVTTYIKIYRSYANKAREIMFAILFFFFIFSNEKYIL